ncbi:protein O-linked-mannose beta-1,2-N-acetylglucosaminyltransferase 1 [Caerostris darwini]|uniref:Alpha-1,3-mannosyl-glycoprotein 2-beta-N-acetylglucosaminyltransferase n=1 Tax=Caerostris darwini TaxID=1538125 RepID=A0AAV4VMH7_9ARAC|nr:protein O-linked-mannose beta-1,2-N-acetylglucosaminyltransferase 1 [Caerostris darwini]
MSHCVYLLLFENLILFKMTRIALAIKFFFAAVSRLFIRRCGISGSSLVAVFLIGVGTLYLITFYFSLNNGKVPPSLEAINETGYTDMPIIVNTETTNVMLRKQQVNHVYERPKLANETVSSLHSIQIGEIMPHCGLLKACSKDEFSVHLYTGKDHTDEPRLCVDGKYIVSKNVNEGGRGLNIAVIDNLTRTIIRVGHFDTYEKESTVLETLLLTLRPGDILILITFDESSRKLSRIARLLFYDLGSALIQNLNYRSSWYFITQKGISGFSPFEDLHLVDNSGWPQYHDARFCVPFEIKGKIIHPDPLPSSNPPRVEFCNEHEDLPLFCDADVVNDPLVPSPVWKQPASNYKIYNVPVIVMSGENVQFLPLTLETLVRQPGIKTSVVVVYYLAKNPMVQNLSQLFGFMSEELSQPATDCERISEAFELHNILFPDAKELLFIGENAILAPDFLFYMGQLLPVLESDSTVLSVSALNENGFKNVSGDATAIYRVESFAGVAMLVRKDFFQKSWCQNDSQIDPLYISSNIVGVNIVPDVSRVTLAAPLSSVTSNQNISHAFLFYDRTITYEQNILLKYSEKLHQQDYDSEIESLLMAAAVLAFDIDSMKQCLHDKEYFQIKIFEELPLFVNNSTSLPNRVLAIFYYQENEHDILTLQHLCNCLGLFHHPLYPARGLYKGVLR